MATGKVCKACAAHNELIILGCFLFRGKGCKLAPVRCKCILRLNKCQAYDFVSENMKQAGKYWNKEQFVVRVSVRPIELADQNRTPRVRDIYE